MGKRLGWALVSGIGFAWACATLADSSVGLPCLATTIDPCGGRLEVAMNSNLKPAKLPKRKLAPVHLGIEGTIGMSDGSNPPPLQELILGIDRNVVLDAQGLPACGLKRIEEATTSQALKACPPALVGEGAMVVAYFERSSLFPKEKLLAFNGGVKNGKTTIYIHAYLSNPVSAPVVMRAKASKVHEGRYGTKLAISVPPIAEGSGFIRKFQLEFFRRFAYRHEKQSFAKARCFDGKLQARAEFIFSEGPPLVGNFKRPCTAKG